MNLALIVYQLDSHNNLTKISGDWDRFAIANNAPQLVRKSVIDKPLFELVSDPQCNHLYKLLIERVKHTGKAVNFEYRCDSPDMRRFMHMGMIPQMGVDGVCFKSTVERLEPRDPVPLLETGINRSGDSIVICSWCKKIKIDDDQWAEIEEAIERLGLFGAQYLPQLSHGLCPSCKKTIWSKLVE